MNDLAVVLYALNRLKESEELYKESLKLNFLSNNPCIGTTMNNLGLVFLSQNRLK